VLVRLRHAWASLRGTYWFLPAVMTLAAAALAVATVSADRRVSPDLSEDVGWIFSGGAEGARAVLQVIAGSVMTTAGIIFSVTIAALSLAASQLGPRLLQNFMRDTGNQVVLGTFLGTFVFCLLVLRTVRGGDPGGFVPALSVTAGLALALACLGVLIYFIHHVSVSIQAPTVVAGVGQKLARLVEEAFPLRETRPEGPRAPELPDGLEVQAARVTADHDGYVQALDEGGLVDLAARADVLIVVERRPGHFVARGRELAFVLPADRCDRRLLAGLRRRFVVGVKRTAEQDVEFAAEELVEMAVRAMSASLNDPFTAISCLDWLGAGLGRAARGEPPRPVRCDAAGRPRLVYRSPIDFAGLADRAFDQIRQYAGGRADVAIRMLETIEQVARSTGGQREHLLVLLRHAEKVHRAAGRALDDPHDLRDMEDRYARLQDLLPNGDQA
jgi:uncharacterized membrane protein